jgi:hypothetical protein
MADTRGVFRLKAVRNDILSGEYVTPDQAFFAGSTATPNVGYFAGGSTAPTVSSVDKMSLADDTTSQAPSANLSAVNRSLMGLGNKSDAYWCGGRYGGPAAFYSGVEKLSYFSDTVSRSPASNLPATQADASGTSNHIGGYIAGGSTPTNVTTVNKLIFATDTCFRFPGANLISAENGAGAVGNQSNCYIGGGETPINSTVDKIVFATDTTTRISANVASLRSVAGASGDSAGYFGGGNDGGPVSTRFKSTVVKFTFSDETTSTLPSANSLRNSVSATQGVANSSAGYFAGGTGSPSPSHFSNATKISFSNDTASNVPSGGNLSATRYNAGSASARSSNFPTTGYFGNTENLKSVASPPNFGYFVGGPLNASGTEKIDFVTEVSSKVPTAFLAEDVSAAAGLASPTASYYMGRANGSAMQRITYSDETCVLVPSGQLPQLTGYAAGTNTDAVGYVAGGQGPSSPYRSWIQRVSYSSETSEMMPSGNLVRSKILPGNFSNMKNGYYVGGDTNFSDCDRLNFSSESVGGVPSGRITNPRGYMQGSGNADAGYTSGGSNGPAGVSYTSRLTYATELMSNIPTAFVPSGAEAGAMSGNLTNGYYTSGYNPPTYLTYTYRISYTNDYSVLVPSAFLQTGNRYLTGTSGRDRNLPQPRPETPTLEVSYSELTTPFTGYSAGGGGPSGRTTNYYKLLYATETASFLPSTNLTSGRSNYLGGYTTTTQGWTQGGYTGPPAYTAESWVDRVTYSTDTSVTVPGAYLPSPGRYGGSTGSSPSAGYYVAGFNTGALNSTLKMPFSTESHALAPGAALSSARYYFCGGGGPDKGYFGGGYPTTQNMDKLVYSIDTMTASPSTNLIIESTRGSVSMMGNATHAYLTGGQSPGPTLPNYGYKIPYSTDTAELISGATAFPRANKVSFGHELEGYSCGGSVPSPYATLTVVDKIVYATDVSQLVPTAFMPEYRGSGSQMSARNFGASGGGTSNVL